MPEHKAPELRFEARLVVKGQPGVELALGSLGEGV